MKDLPKLLSQLVTNLLQLGVNPDLVNFAHSNLNEKYADDSQWTELARALRRQRNYRAAAAVYDTALTIHPQSAKLWYNYGTVLKEWEKLNEAKDVFAHAIKLNPQYPLPYEGIAKIFEEVHRFDDAISYYNKALALVPENAQYCNNIGSCYMGKSDEKKAISYYQKALNINPDLPDALFNLSGIYITNNQFDLARPLVTKLLQLLPDDPEVLGMADSLNSNNEKGFIINVDSAKSLETKVGKKIKKIADELKGNPRSVFISYAWADENTRHFALKLYNDLTKSGYTVVLDQVVNLELFETLYLLVHCQNIIILNDKYYAESCLLGKIPTTVFSSAYPSFSFLSDQMRNAEFVGRIHVIAAVSWELAKHSNENSMVEAGKMAMEFVNPEYFKDIAEFRVFIEGWRVDEIQMIFRSLENYRSFTVAYLGGEHCLAGYPICDFSKEEYYNYGFNALKITLNLSSELMSDIKTNSMKPIEFNMKEHIDWSRYIFKDSEITKCKFWKISNEKSIVIRPSITPNGDAGSVTQEFINWEPL